MPEGDTIHTIAGYLAPRLGGRLVPELCFRQAGAEQRLRNCRVREVSAVGKHLYIELDDDTALRSHLGMHGSWHRYAAGERWRKPARQASIVLQCGDDVFVCFNAREVELVRLASVRARTLGTRLGPDLTAPDPDIGLAVRRARECLEGDALIADVLLDQRAASGIGNVYKSEVLFLMRRLPTTPFGLIPDPELEAHYALAAQLLSRNTGGGPRATRFEDDGAGRLWVYGRRGLGCLRCDAVIQGRRLGVHQRSTFWCPDCQV